MKMVIFCADSFMPECIGGAEQSFETLIQSCKYSYTKIRAKYLTEEDIHRYKSDFWIFGNMTQLNDNMLKTIPKELQYVFIESDYKFCRHRSPGLHLIQGKEKCGCKDTEFGKLIIDFIKGARVVFWKSEKQRDLYFEFYPELADKDYKILSGPFSDESLDYMLSLRGRVKREHKYLIIDSIVKGTGIAEDFCNRNFLPYEKVSNLSPKEMLSRMASYEGLVFFPVGEDTCPRTVIEAKILGLRYIINENVQHQGEDWFKTNDVNKIISYLRSMKDMFWNTIGDFINGVR